MPRYKYTCPNCGEEFTKLQDPEDRGEAECPECGSSQTNKMISRQNLRFVGDGFYRSDGKDKSEGDQ